MVPKKQNYNNLFVLMAFTTLLASACSDPAAPETTPASFPTDTRPPPTSTATQPQSSSLVPPTLTPSPLPTIIPSTPIAGQAHPLVLDSISVQDLQLLHYVGTGVHTFTLWSPDGKYFVRATTRGIYFHDSETFEEVLFMDTGYVVRKLVFSPDGSRLAFAASGRVEVWSTESGEKLLEIETPFDFPRQLEYSPTGYIAAIGRPCIDCDPVSVLVVWDVVTGEELFYYDMIYSHRFDMTMSPDGKTIAYGGGHVLFLDMEDPSHAEHYSPSLEFNPQDVYELSYLPDGEHIFVQTFDDNDVYNNGPSYILSLNGEPTEEVLPGIECDQRTHEDGIITCHNYKKVQRFSYPGWVEVLNYSRDEWFESRTFGPDGDQMVVDTKDGLFVFDTQMRNVLFPLDQIGMQAIAIGMRQVNADSQYFAATTDVGQIDYWDLVTGKLLHSMQISEARIKGVALSPDQSTLASIDEFGVIRMIDINTFSITLSHDLGEVNYGPIVYSPTGSEIALLYGDPSAVFTFDLQSQALTYVGEDVTPWDYYYSSVLGHGPFIYTDAGDIVSWTWQEENVSLSNYSQEEVLEFSYDMSNHWSGPQAAAFSPVGRYAAIGLNNETILIGDTTKVEIIRELVGHSPVTGLHGWTGSFEYLTFSPVNDLLLSIGKDATIRLWDIVSGVELHKIDFYGFADFTPDGRFLIVKSGSLIQVWGVPPLP
ncbi:MAG: hypothetical protein DWQ07_06560 [Chloroflexi bacterium]|nr:MAG: hypothetical protein DWQ07_06560 [Chloroflexota bacterium]MBL1195908.1 hypothetical protein [Chloroflexota bacterium]NOH13201.1 WD40 repeat domain-containing protein [Chloroflexota bacterium]